MPAKLKKGLGLLDLFCIASGAMISSGLFVLPGLAHARAGPGVVLSYLLGALLAAAGVLCIAELTTAMPKAGGDYFFIARSMGQAAGTAAGILSWFSLSLKSAFAVFGMATFIALIVAVNGVLAGLVLCAAFVALNMLGVREAARAQVLLVAGLFGLLTLYVVTGLPKVQVQNFEPFAPRGIMAIFATTGFVFVSYGGLLKVASVAEEVKQPGRVIPAALALSLLVVSAFYTLVVFVTSGVLGAEKLDHSMTPISDGAMVIMGPAGFVVMSLAAILAFVTTANAGIMAASRYLFALGRDGLLPRPLARVGARFRTPHVAILVTGAAICGSLFLKLDVLVEAASTVLILTYIMACLSVIVLRESKLQNYRPAFRAPGYPWIQIAGIIGFAFVLLEMRLEAFLISALLVVAGFLSYWFYGRGTSRRESALLQLIRRITARELVSGSLEDELKNIIRERDEIVLDRFDDIVENSVVLDIDRSLSLEEFFHAVADKLAARVGMGAADLSRLLLKRESDSSTVLAPDLAIPHVVIDGLKSFDILLARCREGIAFRHDAPAVQAVFVLLGTGDERNFHLRALAAIAQIVQEPGFHHRWMAAHGEQGLRDTVLLGKRRRH